MSSAIAGLVAYNVAHLFISLYNQVDAGMHPSFLEKSSEKSGGFFVVTS